MDAKQSIRETKPQRLLPLLENSAQVLWHHRPLDKRLTRIFQGKV